MKSLRFIKNQTMRNSIISLINGILLILLSSCFQYHMRKSGRWPIQEAASSGKITEVKRLIKRGKDVNFSDMWSVTPLAIAAEKGYNDIVVYLIDHGAVVDFHDYWRKTPLFYAVAGNRLDTAKLLLERGADPDVCSGFSSTDCDVNCILEVAACNGNLKMIKLLLKYKASINSAPGVLHAAVHSGNLELVKYLYGHRNSRTHSHDISKDRYALVEAFASDMGQVMRDTPLHIAAKKGHREIIAYLMGKKIPVNIYNESMETPYDVAQSENIRKLLKKYGGKSNKLNSRLLNEIGYAKHEEIESMIKKGADVNARGLDGEAVLHKAIQEDRYQAVRLLLDSGAQINIPTTKGQYVAAGQTPLHYAIRKGNKDIINLLIIRGANLNAKDSQGRYPLNICRDKAIRDMLIKKGAKLSRFHEFIDAIEDKNIEKVNEIIKTGIDCNKYKKNNELPLFYAIEENYNNCKNSRIDVFKILVENGAKINVRFSNGLTPLQQALQSNDCRVAQYLLDLNVNFKNEDGNGNSTFHYAVFSNYDMAAIELINRGADIHKRDSQGRTPIFYSSLNVAKLLLAKGASINALDNYGRAPLHYAGSDGIIRFLLENGARLNIKDKYGRIPLHYVASDPQYCISQLKPSIIEIMIKKGSKCNILDNAGKTPLDMTRSPEMYSVLRKLGAKKGYELRKTEDK